MKHASLWVQSRVIKLENLIIMHPTFVLEICWERLTKLQFRELKEHPQIWGEGWRWWGARWWAGWRQCSTTCACCVACSSPLAAAARRAWRRTRRGPLAARCRSAAPLAHPRASPCPWRSGEAPAGCARCPSLRRAFPGSLWSSPALALALAPELPSAGTSRCSLSRWWCLWSLRPRVLLSLCSTCNHVHRCSEANLCEDGKKLNAKDMTRPQGYGLSNGKAGQIMKKNRKWGSTEPRQQQGRY